MDAEAQANEAEAALALASLGSSTTTPSPSPSPVPFSQQPAAAASPARPGPVVAAIVAASLAVPAMGAATPGNEISPRSSSPHSGTTLASGLTPKHSVGTPSQGDSSSTESPTNVASASSSTTPGSETIRPSRVVQRPPFCGGCGFTFPPKETQGPQNKVKQGWELFTNRYSSSHPIHYLSPHFFICDKCNRVTVECDVIMEKSGSKCGRLFLLKSAEQSQSGESERPSHYRVADFLTFLNHLQKVHGISKDSVDPAVVMRSCPLPNPFPTIQAAKAPPLMVHPTQFPHPHHHQQQQLQQQLQKSNQTQFYQQQFYQQFTRARNAAAFVDVVLSTEGIESLKVLQDELGCVPIFVTVPEGVVMDDGSPVLEHKEDIGYLLAAQTVSPEGQLDMLRPRAVLASSDGKMYSLADFIKLKCTKLVAAFSQGAKDGRLVLKAGRTVPQGLPRDFVELGQIFIGMTVKESSPGSLQRSLPIMDSTPQGMSLSPRDLTQQIISPMSGLPIQTQMNTPPQQARAPRTPQTGDSSLTKRFRSADSFPGQPGERTFEDAEQVQTKQESSFEMQIQPPLRKVKFNIPPPPAAPSAEQEPAPAPAPSLASAPAVEAASSADVQADAKQHPEKLTTAEISELTEYLKLLERALVGLFKEENPNWRIRAAQGMVNHPSASLFQRYDPDAFSQLEDLKARIAEGKSLEFLSFYFHGNNFISDCLKSLDAIPKGDITAAKSLSVQTS